MGSAFHQLCLRYSGTLTPTAPTAIRLWEPLPFFYLPFRSLSYSNRPSINPGKKLKKGKVKTMNSLRSCAKSECLQFTVQDLFFQRRQEIYFYISK